MRTKGLLSAGAALAVAIFAGAQLVPGFTALAAQGNAAGQLAPAGPPQPAPAVVQPTPAQPSGQAPAQRPAPSAEEEQGPAVPSLNLPPPPVEMPDHARRDPATVGRLDPAAQGLGAEPWGGASGRFLSVLLRRMDTPIASRWAHIALRNLLLARASAPSDVNPVDWTAERAWLLLRLGEADPARLLVTGVDVEDFTPKMYQVAVQSALANADPSALCPLQQGLEEVEPRIYRLVDAMCASLAGEPEAASSQIDQARRRGELNEIDIALAQKVVGAAGNTRRAVTIEWEPVERLNAWRFGLASATGMTPPERLIAAAPVQLRAWQAVAPLIAPAERLSSALIAAGLGVLSSQALVDLNALIYDSTGPDELPETDAWQLRLAFAGEDRETRMTAMRRLWTSADGPLEREAVRAMLGRPAARIVPDPKLEADAPELIASMLAAGYDREAARWAPALDDMDDAYADAAWAMLALGAPQGASVDRGLDRVEAFIDRDDSEGQYRSALLVAGLAGLGHIDAEAAARLSERHGLRLGRRSTWTATIDEAARRGQSGTALVLAGTGLQSSDIQSVPPAHLYRAISALRRTGQDFTARMIAAEALART